jgi:hypothetical protein
MAIQGYDEELYFFTSNGGAINDTSPGVGK